jgi:hypothetical protein
MVGVGGFGDATRARDLASSYGCEFAVIAPRP